MRFCSMFNVMGLVEALLHNQPPALEMWIFSEQLQSKIIAKYVMAGHVIYTNSCPSFLHF